MRSLYIILAIMIVVALFVEESEAQRCRRVCYRRRCVTYCRGKREVTYAEDDSALEAREIDAEDVDVEARELDDSAADLDDY